MNYASSKRFLLEQRTRERVRQRVIAARIRKVMAGVDCPCPGCTLLRAIRDEHPADVSMPAVMAPLGVKH